MKLLEKMNVSAAYHICIMYDLLVHVPCDKQLMKVIRKILNQTLLETCLKFEIKGQ